MKVKDETKVWNKNISDEHLSPSSIHDKVGTPSPHNWENTKSQRLEIEQKIQQQRPIKMGA